MNSNGELYKPWIEFKDNLILVVNCGSSSIKVSLFEYDEKIYHRLLDANLKNLNTDKRRLEISCSQGKETFPSAIPLNIGEGLKFIFKTITDKFNFAFTSVMGIGHRFVHGGNQFCSSILIDSTIILDLEKLSDLAPLHNDACLSGIKECLDLYGSIPQIAIFDTSFHQTLPAVAANYAIPNEMSFKFQIKRYGFHGISHEFLWNTYKEHIGQNHPKNSKIITIHLGNGCSITAISGGISIDTSMGFTPAEGLMMATRAGDIDAAIIEFICQHDKKTSSEVMEILNFYSGLLGVSGISSNMETLLELYHKNEKAQLAVDMFCYRIVKYLGSYISVLGGIDAMIFSGGIGENSPIIREQIMSKMEWYGLKLEQKANQQAIGLHPGEIKKINALDSAVPLYVVASDENLFIAKEVQRITCSNFK